MVVQRSVEQTNLGIKFKSPKSGKGRLIVLLPLTIEALAEHKLLQAEEKKALGEAYQDGDLVCAREDGSIIPPGNFSSLFRNTAKRAGLKGVRLHDLRHGHATQLLQAEVHPKVVSERLGHSAIGITLDLYSHVMPGIQKEAAVKLNTALAAAIDKRRETATKVQ